MARISYVSEQYCCIVKLSQLRNYLRVTSDYTNHWPANSSQTFRKYLSKRLWSPNNNRKEFRIDRLGLIGPRAGANTSKNWWVELWTLFIMLDTMSLSLFISQSAVSHYPYSSSFLYSSDSYQIILLLDKENEWPWVKSFNNLELKRVLYSLYLILPRYAW